MITKTEVEGFLSHLNSLRPTITFTAEEEVDGKLPFLDTLLHRKNDGSLDISVYRKPTHTDRYLNFSSHQSRHVKEGIVSYLFHRVRNIAQRENIQVERRKKSAIAEHAWGQQHPILWEETSVLDQAKNNTTLLIKEALHIRLTDLELINRDKGVAIPECWQPVLDHATMTSSTHATPRRGTDDGTIDAT